MQMKLKITAVMPNGDGISARIVGVFLNAEDLVLGEATFSVVLEEAAGLVADQVLDVSITP